MPFAVVEDNYVGMRGNKLCMQSCSTAPEYPGYSSTKTLNLNLHNHLDLKKFST